MFNNVSYSRFGKVYSIDELDEWSTAPDSKVTYNTGKEEFFAKVIFLISLHYQLAQGLTSGSLPVSF